MFHLEPIFQSTHGVAQGSNGMGPFGGIIILLTAILLIVSGGYYLTASLDDLWERHQRALQGRGAVPMRSEAWERNARSRGWANVGLGIAMLLFSIWIIRASPSAPEPEKMSGASINGRQLTEREWEACGKELIGCTEMYGSKGR